MKILLVDDEKEILNLLASMIEPTGYYCKQMSSPSAALAEYQSNPFDLIITDIQMEEMSGIQFIQAIRSFDAKVKIIIVTAFGNFHMAMEALNLGVASIITKPLDFKHFMNILESVSSEILLKGQLLEKEEKIKEYMAVLEKGMEEAKYFQVKLMKIQHPKCFGIKFYTGYLPCDAVGGDIYNIIKKGDLVIFYLADIVGHGVRAAIISSYIKSRLDEWLVDQDINTPLETVRRIKKVFSDVAIFNHLVLTIFMGVYHQKTGVLKYISAGHEKPVVIQRTRGKEKEVKMCRRIIWKNILSKKTTNIMR